MLNSSSFVSVMRKNNSQGMEDYQEVCLRWEVQCHGKQM